MRILRFAAHLNREKAQKIWSLSRQSHYYPTLQMDPSFGEQTTVLRSPFARHDIDDLRMASVIYQSMKTPTISYFTKSNGALAASWICCMAVRTSFLKLMPGNHAGRDFTVSIPRYKQIQHLIELSNVTYRLGRRWWACRQVWQRYFPFYLYLLRVQHSGHHILRFANHIW